MQGAKSVVARDRGISIPVLISWLYSDTTVSYVVITTLASSKAETSANAIRARKEGSHNTHLFPGSGHGVGQLARQLQTF